MLAQLVSDLGTLFHCIFFLAVTCDSGCFEREETVNAWERKRGHEEERVGSWSQSCLPSLGLEINGNSWKGEVTIMRNNLFVTLWRDHQFCRDVDLPPRLSSVPRALLTWEPNSICMVFFFLNQPQLLPCIVSVSSYEVWSRNSLVDSTWQLR